MSISKCDPKTHIDMEDDSTEIGEFMGINNNAVRVGIKRFHSFQPKDKRLSKQLEEIKSNSIKDKYLPQLP